jgi:acyl dehydratase
MKTDHDSILLGHGFYYEELPLGFKFHTKGRTLCEADLNAYLNLTWFTEELFVNLHSHAERSLTGRVVPAGLVFCFAEGLVHLSTENTGQAFLGMTLEVKGPTYLGDTIHSECEVVEARVESKGRRGLVRTENRVVNQKGENTVIYRPLRLVRLRTPIEPATKS